MGDMPRARERYWGKMIWFVASDLGIDTVTTASGALFFQRFCLAEREDFDHHRLAIASLWLATKALTLAMELLNKSAGQGGLLSLAGYRERL